MNKVIITGAGGFIGGALTEKLLKKDVTVIGIDISKESMSRFSDYKNFTPVIADFSKYSQLDKIISDRDIDIFYHFALKGGFGTSLKDCSLQLSNADGACKAIEAAIKCSCKKFVFSGTANQYELNNFINMDYFEPRYTCIYSAGKLAAEFMCKTLAFNNGINYNSGLIAMAYGEGNKSTVSLPNVVINQIIHKQEPKLIQGNNIYDMVYIDEIVSAFIAIGEHGKNMKSYYIGHNSPKTFKQIMTEIRDILDPEVHLNFGAYKDTPSGIDYSKIDLDALYNDSGFQCKSDFKESILKTAEWVRTLNF